tara:strand:- start:1211 stop:1348 length:138 start_codon:yes stop_codon:yes gene_type:complete
VVGVVTTEGGLDEPEPPPHPARREIVTASATEEYVYAFMIEKISF